MRMKCCFLRGPDQWLQTLQYGNRRTGWSYVSPDLTVMPRPETFQFLLNLGGPVGTELRQSRQGLLWCCNASSSLFIAIRALDLCLPMCHSHGFFKEPNTSMHIGLLTNTACVCILETLSANWTPSGRKAAQNWGRWAKRLFCSCSLLPNTGGLAWQVIILRQGAGLISDL